MTAAGHAPAGADGSDPAPAPSTPSSPNQSASPFAPPPNTDPFAPLSQDVHGLLYAFLPVRDLLSFATTSRNLHEHVAHQQHWFELCARRWPALRSPLLDASLSSSSLPSTRAYTDADDDCSLPPSCFRSTFLQHAEAEMNWRKACPVQVTQERLLLRGVLSSWPVTSILLVKANGQEAMLVATGSHIGVFPADASGKIILSELPELVIEVQRSFDKNRAGNINTMKVAPGAPLFVVVAMSDDTIRVFDWTTGYEHMDIEYHTASVWGLSLDTHSSSEEYSSHSARLGHLMMASSAYGEVAIFDTDRSDVPATKFQAHSASWVRALHLDLNRHSLISGSGDSTCKAWDLRMPGEVLMRYVHPNHFEEVRSVECVGNRLFTGCYDGMVREYGLDSGVLKGVRAKHGSYAVECMSLSRETGRLVSVDWDGVVAFEKGPPVGDFDMTPEEVKVRKEDVGVLLDGERMRMGNGAGGSGGRVPATNAFFQREEGNNFYLRPRYHDLALRGGPAFGTVIGCDVVGPAVVRREDSESTLSAKVLCMHHIEERLVLGTKRGDVVSLLFRKGVCE